MAALLVALAVMAVMMSVAMPVWRHDAQRQKEDELIWRGNQYVRAIRLYQSKTGAIPTSVDALVDGHFLRKKYKDPITNDDFELIGGGTMQPGLAPGQGQNLPGAPGRGGAPSQGTAGPSQSRGTTSISQPSFSTMPTGTGSVAAGIVPGGLIGVRSKSKDESIKIYQGRTHYNEWTFTFVNQQPGIGGPGRGVLGGGPGGVPQQRGQPGQFPANPFGGPANGPGNRGGRGTFGPNNPPQFPPNFPGTPGRRGGRL